MTEKKDVSNEADETPDINSILNKLSLDEEKVLLKAVRTTIDGRGKDREGKGMMVSFAGGNETVEKTKQKGKYGKPTMINECSIGELKYEVVKYPNGRFGLRQWVKDGENWGKLINSERGTRVPNSKVILPLDNKQAMKSILNLVIGETVGLVSSDTQIKDLDTTTEKPTISRKEAEEKLVTT